MTPKRAAVLAKPGRMGGKVFRGDCKPQVMAAITSCPFLNHRGDDDAPDLALFCGMTVAFSSRAGALLDNKQQPETLNSQRGNDSGEAPDDPRIVRALASLNSELVNSQRELARKNTELAGVIREKNQLLGMAAHDLRNPLGIIVGV